MCFVVDNTDVLGRRPKRQKPFECNGSLKDGVYVYRPRSKYQNHLRNNNKYI